jgi:hypothetical protein
MKAADGICGTFFNFRNFLRFYFFIIGYYCQVVFDDNGFRAGSGTYSTGNTSIFTDFSGNGPPVQGPAEDDNALRNRMELKQVSGAGLDTFAASCAFTFDYYGKPFFAHIDCVKRAGSSTISEVQTAIGTLFVSSD